MKYAKLVVVMLLALISLEYIERNPWFGGGDAVSSADAVFQAWEQQRSGVWVTVSGEVVKVLEDDNKGSRHQRFLLRLDHRLKVLVAHNIDLAPRAPLHLGDEIVLRGRYEWNDKGGVIHWTHHDPSGRKEGGWITVAGESYR